MRFLLFVRGLPRAAAPLLPIATRLGSTNRHHRTSSSRLFSHFPARLTSSPPQSPPPPQPSPLQSDASLSQRLRYLIKSYGWYALGVYVVLSALDFGVAFAGINLIGAEQVSRITASAKDSFAIIWQSKPTEPGLEEIESITPPGGAGGHEGLYAMLVLAYTVHKTLFFPVRVGLTAALTPRLVGWLRARGWSGGAGARRAATEIRERMKSGRNQD